MKIYQRFAVTVAGASLSLAGIATAPAQATIFNYDFNLNAPNLQGFGSFSYDTSQDQAPSPPPLDTSPLLTNFSLTFSPASFFTQPYDGVQFVNRETAVSYITTTSTGELSSARFIIPFQNSTLASQPAVAIDSSRFFAFTSPSSSSPAAQGAVTYTQVPEPCEVWSPIVLGSLLCTSFMLRSQQKQRKVA